MRLDYIENTILYTQFHLLVAHSYTKSGNATAYILIRGRLLTTSTIITATASNGSHKELCDISLTPLSRFPVF